MEKDEGSSMPTIFPALDCSLDQLQLLKPPKITDSTDNMESNPMGNALLDMFNFHLSSGAGCSSSQIDRLSFADVMQFADYGPKLALNQTMDDQNEVGIRDPEHGFDPIYFLKFPVLAEKSDHHHHHHHHKVSDHNNIHEQLGLANESEEHYDTENAPSVCLRKFQRGSYDQEELEQGNQYDVPSSENASNLKLDQHNLSTNSTNTTEKLGQNEQQIVSLDAPKLAGFSSPNCNPELPQSKPKRKRSRASKNSEEVESQRMTHIAVERNRRKQMNEHLRVLRSLMPGSYVQRGDQASIIGGAIEFVRELEQLLQCLESQKRRRLYAEASSLGTRPSPTDGCLQPNIQPTFPVFPVQTDIKYLDGSLYEPLREDVADNKSPVADIEVKLVGCDAMIKILSQRRPGQLLKTIAALENLQFSILHTNITTIEQTVLYSFNVKVGGECRLSAEDIANSVQQIFNMIHAASMGYIKE
eukprot:Gb_32351 [translate_table: standard]